MISAFEIMRMLKVLHSKSPRPLRKKQKNSKISSCFLALCLYENRPCGRIVLSVCFAPHNNRKMNNFIKLRFSHLPVVCKYLKICPQHCLSSFSWIGGGLSVNKPLNPFHLKCLQWIYITEVWKEINNSYNQSSLLSTACQIPFFHVVKKCSQNRKSGKENQVHFQGAIQI